jgi:hypothetical protein
MLLNVVIIVFQATFQALLMFIANQMMTTWKLVLKALLYCMNWWTTMSLVVTNVSGHGFYNLTNCGITSLLIFDPIVATSLLQSMQTPKLWVLVFFIPLWFNKFTFQNINNVFNFIIVNDIDSSYVLNIIHAFHSSYLILIFQWNFIAYGFHYLFYVPNYFLKGNNNNSFYFFSIICFFFLQDIHDFWMHVNWIEFEILLSYKYEFRTLERKLERYFEWR